MAPHHEGNLTMNDFISRYTDNGKKVGPAQYLAEVMCERISKKQNTGDLPHKFWATPKWNRTFLYQVQLANSLLKMYRVEAIIMALRRRQDVYSLNAQFLDPLIKEMERKINKEEEKLAQSVEDKPVDTTETPRQSFTEKKNILSKLRDL